MVLALSVCDNFTIIHCGDVETESQKTANVHETCILSVARDAKSTTNFD